MSNGLTVWPCVLVDHEVDRRLTELGLDLPGEYADGAAYRPEVDAAIQLNDEAERLRQYLWWSLVTVSHLTNVNSLLDKIRQANPGVAERATSALEAAGGVAAIREALRSPDAALTMFTLFAAALGPVAGQTLVAYPTISYFADDDLSRSDAIC